MFRLKFNIENALIIGFGVNNPMGRQAAEVGTTGKRVFPPSVIGVIPDTSPWVAQFRFQYSANTNEDPFEFVGVSHTLRILVSAMLKLLCYGPPVVCCLKLTLAV